MGQVLALVRVMDTNPIKVSYCCIRHPFTITVIKISCTQVIRQSASVIRVGVAYMNICVSRHLKEKLTWAIHT